MDFLKQYIIQSITAASNNLRLNTQKIEVVALLREAVLKSDDLERDIREMKKITELSKLAIRLSEIYSYLTTGHIDFFRISEKLKEHSQLLIKDLSNMTDSINPADLKKIIVRLHEKEENSQTVQETHKPEEFSVDLSKRKTSDVVFQQEHNDSMKENLIMEDDAEDEQSFFQNFEANILEPVKPVDNLLKQLLTDDPDVNGLIKYAGIMKHNGELSSRAGFEIIANMHKIISKSLYLFASEELSPFKEVIDSVRSCLIVIVAVVKGKEVDITGYLNRAEDFGRQIQALKNKVD